MAGGKLPFGVKNDIRTLYLPLQVDRILSPEQADHAARYGRNLLRVAQVGERVTIKTLSKRWIGSSESDHIAILEKLADGNFKVVNASRRFPSGKEDVQGCFYYDKEVV